jgi:hypothetical protein
MFITGAATGVGSDRREPPARRTTNGLERRWVRRSFRAQQEPCAAARNCGTRWLGWLSIFWSVVSGQLSKELARGVGRLPMFGRLTSNEELSHWDTTPWVSVIVPES